MAAKKILIADDAPDILTLLDQYLVSCGYEVLVARDGEEVCAKAKALKPDLLIMDVLMPKMSGYDALRKIRRNDGQQQIPAIMVSARRGMRDFFIDIPNVEFVAKPFDIQELLGKVRRFLDGSGVIVHETPAACVIPSTPVRHRSVIVLGVQDGLTEKILNAISSMGIEAERALHEEDACKEAQKMRPEKIFCQYWEDDKILDAKKVANRFLKTPGLAAIPFYVYCEDRNALEVMKLFREDKILSYRESIDLLPKIKNLLKAPV